MRLIHSLEINEEAQVGAARRAVRRFAAPLGFTEDELAEVDIVVQEIGTNAVRYATAGGWLHFTNPLAGAHGVELFYWDKGPGIYNIDRAVRDGVSTSGSLGGGMGAIGRLMNEFEVYSTVRGTTSRLTRSRRTRHGTALLGRKWPATAQQQQQQTSERLATDATMPPTLTAARGQLGSWSRPRPGERVNGDTYFVSRYHTSELYAVIDGLGHGAGASEAALVATDSLSQWQGEPLDEVFWAVHDVMRATRGAVMGACILDREAESFYYAGVGNIEFRAFNAPEPIRPIPNNGTLGMRLSNIRIWTHKWGEGTTFVLASDGISASWDIANYPGLLAKSPQVLAGVLMRDYSRTSDDATVLVIR